MLSHMVYQSQIPHLRESCTNIQNLPSHSQRGVVPSCTQRAPGKLQKGLGLYIVVLFCHHTVPWLQKMLLSHGPQS